MCGWAGFWKDSRPRDELEACARRMADTLIHRGPDDGGVWADAESGIALGFRRLAIIDLSPQGHQPMQSQSGRYVIVFNGEVYNFADLRRELEPLGHRFRGHSDTEVMLAAIEQWGLKAAVARFAGMFAFALWDRAERTLSLVRDRLGVKPLYYGWAGKTLLCGSELKALRAHPDFRAEVDRGALALMMRHSYVPAPHSIYQGIFKLPPASILTLASPTDRPEPVAYWSAREAALQGSTNLLDGSENEIVEQLDVLLRDAVRLRMVADVPLGAFLSGGIDSSLVVALMQAQSERAVKTFTIGFEDAAHNEADYARAVARHLGTEHTDLYVTPREAQAVIPNLAQIYDEPFSDSSQIPTFLVAEMTRKSVTVSLSGDGGDELFGGYSRYNVVPALWSKTRRVPPVLRRGLGNFGRNGTAGRLGQLAQVASAPDSQSLYRYFMSHWKSPAEIVIGAREPATYLSDPQHWIAGDFRHRMMYADTMSYLPDDILAKVDRASMAVSLEAREPLLDHRLLEFAWRIPPAMKVRNGNGKWILRQVLGRYIPQEMIDRPKMGFGVPVGAWLRDPLRDWAEALLDERRLKNEGFFDPLPIRRKWQEHLSGARNWKGYLWDVLMFQAWLEHWN